MLYYRRTDGGRKEKPTAFLHDLHSYCVSLMFINLTRLLGLSTLGCEIRVISGAVLVEGQRLGRQAGSSADL